MTHAVISRPACSTSPYVDISIEGLTLFARHGVGEDERLLGQNFILDLTLQVEAQSSLTSDDIADSVNYAHVVDLVRARFTTRSFCLLEAVAHHVIEALLTEFERVQHVRLRVHKPSAPVDAVFSSISVTLERARHG